MMPTHFPQVSSEGNNTPVGIVDLYEVSQRHLRAFIGIYICKEFRGKGYADEALRLIEEYAQNTLHLHQLGAKIEESHTRAVKRFSELGYKCSGKLHDWLSAPNGQYSNMLIYTKSLG